MVNKNSYRPCLVNGNVKALFHEWIGGTVNDLYALVEFEDGTLGAGQPQCIKFLDTKSKLLDFANFFKDE